MQMKDFLLIFSLEIPGFFNNIIIFVLLCMIIIIIHVLKTIPTLTNGALILPVSIILRKNASPFLFYIIYFLKNQVYRHTNCTIHNTEFSSEPNQGYIHTSQNENTAIFRQQSVRWSHICTRRTVFTKSTVDNL